MNRAFTVPRGTFTPDGLCCLTDAQWHAEHDESPSIADAYRGLARMKSNIGAACDYARTFGIRSRIGGVPRGEAPAFGVSRVSR